MVRYGFGELGIPLLTAIADDRNLASNHVLGKAGLIYRKTYHLDGRAIRFHSLTREEFRQARRSVGNGADQRGSQE